MQDLQFIDARTWLTCPSFEAMIHYLYTGEVTFAPFYSDPRHEIPAEARRGGWNAEKPPSPSAKSVYRLADKVTGFTHVRYPSNSLASV